jgi:hypothetical protein
VGDAPVREKWNGERHSSEMAKADARDHLSRALKRAFPLPDSGAFSDLLEAINSRTTTSR